MDPETEKTSMFSRVGSFYYRGLEDAAKKEAIRMAHLTFQTRAYRQLDNIMQSISSGGYFPGNFRVVRFTDKQVAWYGVKQALQQRVSITYVVDSEIPPEEVVKTWDIRQANVANNRASCNGIRFNLRSAIDTGVVVSETPFTDFPDIFVLNKLFVQLSDDAPATTRACYIVDASNFVVAVSNQTSTAAANGSFEFTFSGVDGSPVRLNTASIYRVYFSIRVDEVEVGTTLSRLLYYSFRAAGSPVASGGSTSALNMMSGTNAVVTGYTPAVIFETEGVTQLPGEKVKKTVTGREGQLTIPDHFNPVTALNKGLSVRYKPLLLPDEDYGDTVLPQDAELVYGLLVDPELMVTSISLDDGTVLLANQDFSTEFGILHFFENPIKLFPKMKFMARSYIERRRNLYCYPLNLSNVYGPVNRVVDYYRKTQSPKALYYAAAQAIGMPVAEEDDVISSVSPLLDGAAYYTEKGHRYDAAYPHTHYAPGTIIKQNEVLTGTELFRMYSAGDTLPDNLKGVQLRHSSAVNGLYVPNKDGVIFRGEYFRPEYEELVPGALDRYYSYIEYQERNLYEEYRPRTEFLFENGKFAQGTNGALLDMRGNPSSTTGPGGMPAITGNFAWYGITDGGASVPEDKNWSVSFWYKYAVVPSGSGSYNMLGYYPLSNFWIINLSSGGLAFSWSDPSTGGFNYAFQLASTQNNPVNVWHHVAVSINRETGTFSFYFDGRLVGNDTQAKFKNVSLVPGYPFRSSSAATLEAGGVAMADVAFYKGYALEDSDVAKLYSDGNSGISAGKTLLPDTVQEGNLLEHLMDQALAGRWILVMLNDNMMPRTMQIRLNEFLRRETPLGSVLLYATLDGILAETEIADV